MKIENAEWDNKRLVGRKKSATVKAIESLKVGEVKRIEYDDIKPSTFAVTIHRLNANSKHLEYYHERKGIAVVRRLK